MIDVCGGFYTRVKQTTLKLLQREGASNPPPLLKERNRNETEGGSTVESLSCRRAQPRGEDSINPRSKFALSHYTLLECTSVWGVNHSIQTHSLTCQGQHQHIMKALAVNNASPRHNRLSKWMRLILKWTAVMLLLWTNTSGELHTGDTNGS